VRRFLMRGRGLLQRASVRVERGRTFQVRRGMLEPYPPGVMQVGEDSGDAATVTWPAGRERAPGTAIEMSEQKLVHRVVDGINFQ
jgi:hypothetical protein